ncbi:hypothetical protein AB4Z34_34785 [Ensifer sp. 2YAB10]|uniref:hypothetical protein n=1 Tax=unclassified Ensifer TaxID=2633371 RepID=UPI003F8F70E5
MTLSLLVSLQRSVVIKRFHSGTRKITLAMCALLASIRCAVVLLCSLVVLAAGSAGAQEASAWAEVISGATHVPGVGPIRYSVGYSSVGYDHFRSEIFVQWRDGAGRTQTIYDGIYDNPPAKVWGVQGHLCVSMQICARYEDVCTARVIAYRYDAAAKVFAELENGGTLCHH